MEQVRGDRGAQARQTGPRGQAEEHHRRHPLARRHPAGHGLRQAAPRYVYDSAGAFFQCRDQGARPKQDADVRPRITGYDERLADLDAMGIDMQLVMPPPNQCFYTVPLDIAVKAARMVNDGLAEYVARKADRFVALGTVPLIDCAEA